MFTHLAMFIACLGIDYTYVKWVSSIQARNRFHAACYSALCVLLGQVTTIFCVYDYWLILPSCLGHAFGTIVAMSYDYNKDRTNPRDF